MAEQNGTPPRSRGREIFFDIITLLMLIGSVVVLGGSFVIVANPDVPFNPFPPPTLPPVLGLATFTPTATATATATASPTPSSTPTATATHTPTFTPTATITNTPTATVTPSPTLTPTVTPTPVLPNLPTNTPDPATPVTEEGLPAQPGIVIPTGASEPLSLQPEAPFPFIAEAPTYQANRNSRGCDWSSIAGSVVGLLGEPLLNIAVEVTGTDFAEVRFSGAATAFGPSGFEINIGDTPRRRTFGVRLLGLTGEPISDLIEVTTGDTCETNVVVIRFSQVRNY